MKAAIDVHAELDVKASAGVHKIPLSLVAEAGGYDCTAQAAALQKGLGRG